MTTQVIPTPDGTTPYITQTTTLDGVPYLLSFYYSQREDRWYLLLSTVDGTPIYGAVKLVCNWPLFAQCASQSKPPGAWIMVSSTQDLSPPGLNDLAAGGRCQLTYTPVADLIAATGNQSQLQGTATVEEGSTSILFSNPQSLPSGTGLVFSEQSNITYFLAASISDATSGTLTSPYTGPSGSGTVVAQATAGTLLVSPNPTQSTGGGAAPLALDGLMWLLPGLSIVSSGSEGPVILNCSNKIITATLLTGDPSYTYSVTLRFRGVMEGKTYTGGIAGGATGINGGMFYTGGTPAGGGGYQAVHNIYSLTISSPSQIYYLNYQPVGYTDHTVFEADYTVTIPIAGGATVTLTADSGGDSEEIANQTDGQGGGTISLPGLSTPPQPYYGQFAIMNVGSVQ